MTATLPEPPRSALPKIPRRRLRERIARLERPLVLAGLALLALHLLDLAFSGPHTSLPGVLAIIAIAAACALARPHVTRPARVVLGVVVGLLMLGFGVISHGLHVVNSGPDWTDVTGVGMGAIVNCSSLGGLVAPDEIPTNRAYRDSGGPTTQLWELPDAGHTGGLRTHPAEYERRTTAFLDRALGLKETS